MNYKEYNQYRLGLAGEGQADIIEEYLQSKKGRVLNVGCGLYADVVENMSRYCQHLVAVDYERSRIKSSSEGLKGRLKISFAVANAYSLPFSDLSFDYIVALGLLFDIREPEKLFAELSRIIRPSGKVMLTNSVREPKEPYIAIAESVGLALIQEAEGDCRSASGDVKRRYLLVFEKKERL